MRLSRFLFIIALLGFMLLAWHWLPYICPVTVMNLGGDYAIRLPNGYALIRPGPGCVVLVRPNRSGAVLPTIDGYRVHRHLIIGHVRKWDSSSKPGYFVVDMRTGEKWQALSKPEWARVLKKHGIENPPPLVPPTKFSGCRARF